MRIHYILQFRTLICVGAHSLLHEAKLHVLCAAESLASIHPEIYQCINSYVRTYRECETAISIATPAP